MTQASQLTGRVAIVTGANHGIGAATARALAEAGAGVLVNYLRLQDPDDRGLPAAYGEARAGGAADVVAAIEAAGGRVASAEADLSDPATPAMLFDTAEKELGPVDILINNASGWMADTFKLSGTDRLGRSYRQLDPESADRMLNVDARASALMIAEFSRRHEGRGAGWGRIVGLTSGGPLGFPEEVSYGAAKAALENYHFSAALELADRGITSNVVQPPVTDTGWVTDEVRSHVESSTTLFSVAQPEDVAAVVLWLCSEEARFVTANKIEMR